MLENSAKAEIGGRSWLQHTLAFLVNATGSIVIWKGYEKKIKEKGDNPVTYALINFALGTAGTELQIWTQPTRAIDDWEKYKKKYLMSRNPGIERTGIDFFSSFQENEIIAGVQFRF